jgi:hypothetical protein
MGSSFFMRELQGLDLFLPDDSKKELPRKPLKQFGFRQRLGSTAKAVVKDSLGSTMRPLLFENNTGRMNPPGAPPPWLLGFSATQRFPIRWFRAERRVKTMRCQPVKAGFYFNFDTPG